MVALLKTFSAVFAFHMQRPYAYRVFSHQKHTKDVRLYGKSPKRPYAYEGKTPSSLYQPKGANQQMYVNYLNDPQKSVIFATGPAGCGKTLFACCTAADALQRGTISRIILTRPVVSVEEELGFLPGNIQRKMDPWLQPLFDVFLEYYTQKELDNMILDGRLEISPLGFMRGRTFKDSFIIADEMQNSSPKQMLMMLTRIGEGSKMVITGDLNQSDLVPQSVSGLADFLSKYRVYQQINETMIQHIEMTADDVQRSKVVAQILNIYDVQANSRDRTTKVCASNSDAAIIPKSSEPKHTPIEPLPPLPPQHDINETISSPEIKRPMYKEPPYL